VLDTGLGQLTAAAIKGMTGRFIEGMMRPRVGPRVRIRFPPAESRANSGTDVEGRRISWCNDESTKCSGSSQLAPPNASQHACRSSQHLQPSTPSRLALDAPDLPSRGAENDRRKARSTIASWNWKRRLPRFPEAGKRACARRGWWPRDCQEWHKRWSKR